MGAMVFGTVNRERIQLNEETLWMGGPRDTDNPEARAALPEVRRLLFEGRPVEAYALAERKLMGKPWRLESYQSLADLRLNFDHEGEITDYQRWLDLDSGVAGVTYRLDGVRYTREVFASHPDRVIVVRSHGRPAWRAHVRRLDRSATGCSHRNRRQRSTQPDWPARRRQGPVVPRVGARDRGRRIAGNISGTHPRVRRQRGDDHRGGRHELQGQRSAGAGAAGSDARRRENVRATASRRTAPITSVCIDASRFGWARQQRREADADGRTARSREARRIGSRRSTRCTFSSAATY